MAYSLFDARVINFGDIKKDITNKRDKLNLTENADEIKLCEYKLKFLAFLETKELARKIFQENLPSSTLDNATVFSNLNSTIAKFIKQSLNTPEQSNIDFRIKLINGLLTFLTIVFLGLYLTSAILPIVFPNPLHSIFEVVLYASAAITLIAILGGSGAIARKWYQKPEDNTLINELNELCTPVAYEKSLYEIQYTSFLS